MYVVVLQTLRRSLDLNYILDRVGIYEKLLMEIFNADFEESSYWNQRVVKVSPIWTV